MVNGKLIMIEKLGHFYDELSEATVSKLYRILINVIEIPEQKFKTSQIVKFDFKQSRLPSTLSIQSEWFFGLSMVTSIFFKIRRSK